MRVMTISLVCPLGGEMAEVTAVCDRDGLVGVVGCPLAEPGTACLAPCEAEVRQWCEYAEL